MASRVEQKRELRLQREARAAAEANRALRRRRLGMLLIALGVAAAVVVIAVLATSGGGSKTTDPTGAVEGAAEVQQMFAGVPQEGFVVGKPDAPVTLVEFADLQCPFCRDAALGSLPTLMRDYVRPGKMRIEFRNFAILGPDSEKAARGLESAASQGRAWQFIDLFYRNQGEENSGYVTDAFIRKIARNVDGLDAGAVVQASNDGKGDSVGIAHTDAQKYGIDSTPSFLVGRTGGPLRPLTPASPSDPNGYRPAIESLLSGR